MQRVYPVSYVYSHVFDLEKNFDPDAAFATIKRIWHYSIYWTVVYLAVVLALQRLMRSRPPFRLQTLLLLWNFSQAAINIVGTCRALPEIIYGLFIFEFPSCFCNAGLVTKLGAFWLWLYGYSKIWDLCDTLFIVLRKRPLTYLHLIHHSLTFILTYYFGAQEFALGAVLAGVNATVHSFMYSYFTVKCLGIHVPKSIAIGITLLQILQLFLYFLMPLLIIPQIYSGRTCSGNYLCCFLCSGMNGLYLILFINYFYKKYFHIKKSVKGYAQNGKKSIKGHAHNGKIH